MYALFVSMKETPCLCGCGKPVDIESVKAGKPFKHESCRRKYGKECGACGVDPVELESLLVRVAN